MNRTEELLKDLNPMQQKAASTLEGPVLILAGAGSGKTKALTHRIAMLIESGVAPWQILAVTFTNKAATEMKHRIQKLLHVQSADTKPWQGEPTNMPMMGTFHSICARILRRDIESLGRERSFVIYDTDDQKKLLSDIIKSMNLDEKECKPKVVATYISRFKCEGLNPTQALEQASHSQMIQTIRIYDAYQKALKEANALDFDDLLLETVRLFKEFPDVLERYQNTWKYIHVDEYQDTNHIQYILVSLLASKYRNICVIGDPDQSIYAFRGADIRNILEFNKEYKDAVHITLDQNYRSTQIILDGAGAVIELNSNRPEKKMWTEKKDGEKIIIHEVSDEKREAKEAIERVKKMRDTGLTLNDQVILYRTNAQSRLLEEACLRYGVPYRIIGGVKFYARKEIKDILAYLHVIQNPNDGIAMRRIINVPSRKLGETTLQKIEDYASHHSINYWQALQEIPQIADINEPTKLRLQLFVDHLKNWQELKHTMTVAELTKIIIETCSLESYFNDGTDEGKTRFENVQELLTVMHKYDGLEPEVSLISFLEEVALVSEVDKLNQIEDDALTLMTLHLCKGLEFDHVTITGCEEGIFPHTNSLLNKDEMEEECRIMYVGMTRAKKYLTLMHATNRTLFGQSQTNMPSRFLDAIPDAIVERRSDEVLSAFAWATETAQQKIWSKHPVKAFNQHAFTDVEFNQDISYEDEIDRSQYDIGTVVSHPTFGNGTIIGKRGDIVEVRFTSGQIKNLALSIAPLRIVS